MKAAEMTLLALLAQYDVSEHDAVTVLAQRLAQRARPGAADLTTAEDSFWDKHSGLGPAKKTGAGAGAAAEVADLVEAAAASLTVAGAAALIGVHRSRVAHKIGAGELYSFKLGARRRLPIWQFTGPGAVLPGLDQVLAALPADLHPATVEGFFSTANPDLGGLTPAHWLATGGDPGAVVDEAAGIDQW